MTQCEVGFDKCKYSAATRQNFYFLFQIVMVLVLIAGSDRTSAARLPGMVAGLIFADEVISTCVRGGPDFV